MVDLPKWFTPEWLANSTLEQRYNVWCNAREKGGLVGEALAEAIKTSGLAYTPRGFLPMDDPRVIKMEEIINSPEGRKKCQVAADAGLPSLAGVETDIQAALGADYCGENGTTMTAGSFVADVVRSQGYIDAGQRRMPAGSTAKTARFFVRRTR